jgi:hypothetical protein
MITMIDDFCDETVSDHLTKIIKAILEVFNPINIRRAFEHTCFKNIFKDRNFLIEFLE